MTTGYPLMPSEVRRAKQIRYFKSDWAGYCDAEDAESISTEALDASIDNLHCTDYTPQSDSAPDLLNSLNPTTDVDIPTALAPEAVSPLS